MTKTKIPNLEFREGVELTTKRMKEIVEKFLNVRKTIEVLEKEAEELKGKIIDYSIYKNIEIVEGNNNSLIINKQDYISFGLKKDRKELDNFIKEKGYWDMFSELDKNKLSNAIKNKSIKKSDLKFIENFSEKKKIYRLISDIGKVKSNSKITVVEISRNQEKLEKANIKYDEDKKVYKSRHSVFKNYFKCSFKTLDSSNILKKEKLEDFLREYLNKNEHVLEARFFIYENLFFIFFATHNNYKNNLFLDDLNNKLSEFGNFDEGFLQTVSEINKVFVNELVEKIQNGLFDLVKEVLKK